MYLKTHSVHLLKMAGILMISLILLTVIVAPAFAWKPQTHVYSANLLLEEIKANNGYVEIRPYGKFQVPTDYVQAIQVYPDYFRAGSLGPDAFPDIYIGQAFTHPANTDKWLEYIWRQMQANPNSLPIKAFVLGFMVHAAGDAFGHDYINNWAGGPFPTVSDGVTMAELKNIIRHVVVESYIDKQISTLYKQPDYLKITAPVDFIFNTMVVNGSCDNGFSGIYDQTGGEYPTHLKTFMDLRKSLKDEINSLGDPNPLIPWELPAAAKKAYLEAWVDDIDHGLKDWVGASQEVARNMVNGNGVDGLTDPITSWASDNLIVMLGAPDVVQWVSDAIGSVTDFVAGFITPLQDAINYLKNRFYNYIINETLGISLDELKEWAKNPESYLNNSIKGPDGQNLFQNDAMTRLTQDLGNFRVGAGATNQSFNAFYNTLNMAKLELISRSGVDELINRATGSPGTLVADVGGQSLPVMNFNYGLDLSDQWQRSPLYQKYQAVFEAVTPMSGQWSLEGWGDRRNSNFKGDVSFVTGVVGQAAQFNTNGYYQVPDYWNFSYMESFTLAAWVYPTSYYAYASIVSKVNPNRDFWFYLNNGYPSVQFINMNGKVCSCTSDYQIPLNRWSHVAAVWTGTKWQLYLNGNLIKEADFTGYAPSWTGSRMGIGTMDWNFFFKGKLDEVKVFKYSLTAAEIGNLYRTPLPKGIWTFEGNAGDQSPNNAGGTLFGGATITNGPDSSTAGIIGQGLSLNGSGYVYIPNYTSFNNMKSFTLSAWVNPVNYYSYASIISKVDPNRDFWLYLNNGYPSVQFINANGKVCSCTSDSQVPLSQWSHIVAVWAGTKWQLYLNGNLVKEADFTGYAPSWTGAQMGIGTMDWYYFFTGRIDEVKVFEGALTPGHVYNEWLNGFVKHAP